MKNLCNATSYDTLQDKYEVSSDDKGSTNSLQRERKRKLKIFQAVVTKNLECVGPVRKSNQLMFRNRNESGNVI